MISKEKESNHVPMLRIEEDDLHSIEVLHNYVNLMRC